MSVEEATQFPHLVRFETFEVNLNSGELFHDGERVKLPEQSFRILAMLLERPGEVVLRTELLLQLASGVEAPAYKATSPSQKSATTDVAGITDPRGTLNAVSSFFTEHHTLTREQFLELVEKYGRR